MNATAVTLLCALAALALWCLIAGVRKLRARRRVKRRLQEIGCAMGGR